MTGLWRLVAPCMRGREDMIRQIAVATAIASIGLSGTALAAQPATLGAVQGSVLVNQTGKYQPVKASTSLRAGDRVIATDGSARLTYADGCVVSITARSMATIGAESPCGGSSNLVRVANQGYDDGGGMFGAGSADFLLFLGFGLVTLGVTAAALNDDENPTSP